jgi:hypothetical protein
MRLICNKGFYKFFPDFIGEVKLWENKNGIRLYNRGEYWTFESLAKLPNYSFMGHLLYGIIPATKNYAGDPVDVLAKNGLTYNVNLATITPKAFVIIQRLDYAEGAFLTFPSLPQAFALDKNLNTITGFEAFIDVKLNIYKVERFLYEDI